MLRSVTISLFVVLGGWTTAMAQDPGESPSSEQPLEPVAQGPIHEAFAEPIRLDAEPSPIVTEAPPEPIDEVPPQTKPDEQGLVWIPGYWAWDVETERFVWVSGVWRKGPPGRTWTPGQWVEVEGGYRWVSGAWVSDGTQVASDQADGVGPEILPAPPPTLEEGPNTPQPSDEYFWVPGCWKYQNDRYAWRPGFWTTYYPEWVWVPDQYLWTGGGCVFVSGYWDYPWHRRGILYAPCHVDSYAALAGYRYTPSVALDCTRLLLHLWVGPHFGHYYYGDYGYGDYGVWHHSRASLYPWYRYDHHYHRHGYDPILTHYSVRLRHNIPDLHNWLHGHHVHWSHNRSADHGPDGHPADHRGRPDGRVIARDEGHGTEAADVGVGNVASRRDEGAGRDRLRGQLPRLTSRQPRLATTSDVLHSLNEGYRELGIEPPQTRGSITDRRIFGARAAGANPLGRAIRSQADLSRVPSGRPARTQGGASEHGAAAGLSDETVTDRSRLEGENRSESTARPAQLPRDRLSVDAQPSTLNPQPSTRSQRPRDRLSVDAGRQPVESLNRRGSTVLERRRMQLRADAESPRAVAEGPGDAHVRPGAALRFDAPRTELRVPRAFSGDSSATLRSSPARGAARSEDQPRAVQIPRTLGSEPAVRSNRAARPSPSPTMSRKLPRLERAAPAGGGAAAAGRARVERAARPTIAPPARASHLNHSGPPAGRSRMSVPSPARQPARAAATRRGAPGPASSGINISRIKGSRDANQIRAARDAISRKGK